MLAIHIATMRHDKAFSAGRGVSEALLSRLGRSIDRWAVA